MAVFVKVNYDTADADRQLGASQSAIAENYKKLGEIANESLKLDKIKDAFEGLKDMSETWLPLLGDENEELSKMVDKGLKLGEAGAKIGGFFGPWGAAIGAIIGGLSGVFAYAFEAEEELEKKAKAAREELEKQEEAARKVAIETQGIVDSLKNLDKTDLAGVTAALSQTREEIKKTKEAIDQAQGSAVGMIERWMILLSIQEGNVLEARNALLTALGEGANQIDDTLDRSTRKTSDIKDEADKAKKAMEDLQVKLGNVYRQIDEVRDESAAQSLAKETVALMSEIDKQTAIYSASMDELDRRRQKSLQKKKETQEEDLAASQEFERQLRNSERQAQEEEENANAEFLRQLRNSEEKARLQEIDDLIAFNKLVIDLEKERSAETQRIAEQQAEASAQAYQEQLDRIKSYLDPFAQIIGRSFDLIAANIAKGEKPLAGYGNALRGFIGDVLKAYAKKWGAQALGEIAEGIAWAVAPIPGAREVAATHFASAATFGLAATAAGGASLLAGRNTQVPAPASSGGGASPSSLDRSNPSLGSNDKGGFTPGGNISVTLAGNMFLEGGDRDIAKAGKRLGQAISASRRDVALDTGVH